MKELKILYIHPHESHNTFDFLSCLLRISNYLNSRREELIGKIQEDYLDLRFEGLPRFIPKNIKKYRIELTRLLERKREEFNYNLVAISCYSQFKYLNTVEIASIIKNYIDPECNVVVGGPHPTILPQDFQPGNLPDYIEKEYGKNKAPFDFIIKNEGEIPFLNLISGILSGTIQLRENIMDSGSIIESETIQNLDDVPIIDFNLYKKYRKDIAEFGQINIDFSRGCPFRCKICTNSTDLMPCYKNVRIKSIDRCIEELKTIRETKWLHFNTLYLSDMIFLPRRSYREEFYEKFKALKKDEIGFPYQIMINERVELCSETDLKNYKNLDIVPQIGFESGSKTMLKRMGKVNGKNQNLRDKNIENYLKKMEKIIQVSAEIELTILLNYILSPPGSDAHTIKESWNFFLEKRFKGKSLVERYNINLYFSKYSALYGSKIFDDVEDKFGGKIYFKQWWKIFNEDQRALSALVEPSLTLSLIKSLNMNQDFLKQLFRLQINRKNEFYHPAKFLKLNHENMKLLQFLGESEIISFN